MKFEDCLWSRGVPALMKQQLQSPSQKYWDKTAKPAFLTLWSHHASVWEGKEDRGDGGWFPASWCIDCTNFQTLVSSIYFGAGSRPLTEYLTVYTSYILEHTTHFCQYGVPPAIEIKYLGTDTSENFPWGKENWSPSSEMKRNGIKVFLILREWDNSNLSLKVKISNTSGV